MHALFTLGMLFPSRFRLKSEDTGFGLLAVFNETRYHYLVSTKKNIRAKMRSTVKGVVHEFLERR